MTAKAKRRRVTENIIYQENLINQSFPIYLETPSIESPGSIVRSSISGCRPLDPGSNPGQGAYFSGSNPFRHSSHRLTSYPPYFSPKF